MSPPAPNPSDIFCPNKFPTRECAWVGTLSPSVNQTSSPHGISGSSLGNTPLCAQRIATIALDVIGLSARNFVLLRNPPPCVRTVNCCFFIFFFWSSNWSRHETPRVSDKAKILLAPQISRRIISPDVIHHHPSFHHVLTNSSPIMMLGGQSLGALQ